MKSCIYVTVVIWLLTSSFAYGQTLQRLLASDNQNLIELATRDCFLLAKQEFQLQEPNGSRKYNLDSLNCFGFAKSVAIQTEAGLIVQKSIIEPWKTDSNVVDYPNYNPVLSAFLVYGEENKQWKELDISPIDSGTEIPSSERILIKDSLFIGKGFKIDPLPGEKDGWILWIKEEGENVSITPLKQKITIPNSCGVDTVVNLQGEKEYDFGVLVIPVCSVPCVVEFRISALVEFLSDSWKVIPLIYNEKKDTDGHKLVVAVDKQSKCKDVCGSVFPPVQNKRK